MDPTLQWVLGGVFTLCLAIGAGFLKYLFSVINTHKTDMSNEIERLRNDVEARRLETRDLLLELIDTKFTAIWESIRDLKDKLN